jgi:hypothetical protein
MLDLILAMLIPKMQGNKMLSIGKMKSLMKNIDIRLIPLKIMEKDILKFYKKYIHKLYNQLKDAYKEVKKY